MAVDAALIKKMRRYLDESDDSKFTDDDLTEILNDYPSFNKAVSVGWTLKAGKIQKELGMIDEYSTGNESYKYTNLTTAINAALSMSKQYESLYQQEQSDTSSSIMLRFSTPDVI